MYDVSVADYAPGDGDIYAGYIDGAYQSYQPLRKRFPGKLIVPIAVFPSTDAGIVFDGPPDNSTWPQVVDWVVMRRRAGVDPTVYTNSSSWGTGVSAFNQRGVTPPHWWIAAWPGGPGVPTGAVAHQYASNARYDTSVVLDYWPGVDAAPAGTPATHPVVAPPPPFISTPQGDDMIILQANADQSQNFGGVISLLSGHLLAPFADIADVEAVKATGVPLVAVSVATYKSIEAASSALAGKLTGTLSVNGSLQAG